MGRAQGEQYALLDEYELVLAMRRDEEGAFTEFVARFHPLLLQQAKMAHVPPGERDELVTEVLGDVAVHVAAPGAPLPRSVAGYLVTSLRHRLLNARRNGARRERWSEGALTELETHPERAVLTTCSEASLRASRGAGWEPSPLRPALARLAAALDGELTDEERRIVSWLGHKISHRQIAEWLGITPTAAAKRAARLRARLRNAAARYAAGCSAAERAELERFFQRVARGEER